ncbi:hypothetical protein NC651_004538 [Populus alba x Populus x berolinensis]|nr:hypothetical protein NC651_004538 [Populus alba x Populus x berolinensis]
MLPLDFWKHKVSCTCKALSSTLCAFQHSLKHFARHLHTGS